MIIPEISQDREVQLRYEELRHDGLSHNLAEVLACRAFPGINGTNKAFNRGRVNSNQFANCPALGDYYRAHAESAGVSIAGKYYCHGLGRYPGDPKAWVSDTTDVLRVARERNLNIDGIVTHQGHPVEPEPDIPLAEDLWERDTRSLMEASPGMRHEDAREEVFRVRTGQVDHGDLLVEDDVPHPADILALEEP